MSPSMRAADCVVIGGGVIGLAIAYELGERRKRVLVLERDRPGRGATWAAGGMLAPVAEAELEQAELVTFAVESLARYPSFVSRLETAAAVPCRYAAEGTLCVALTRDHRAELGHLHETMRRKGLEAREVDAAAVRELEPHVSGRALGGLELAGDHQVDPRALTAALERGVAAHGGEILHGARVDEVTAARGAVDGVRGIDPEGAPFELRADTVVVATGAWTDRDLRLPCGPLGLRPVKGQLVRLRGSRLLEHVLRTPDVYMVPRHDGELLVGATMEEMGFDTSVTAGAVIDLLRRGWEAVPGLYDLELAEVSVGLRSAVDDHLPVVGAAATEGLFLAVGHHRSGVLLAPATAHHLAEGIVCGTLPGDLDPFRPARLAAGVSEAVGKP